MTKVMMHLENYNEIYFDCVNHSDDHDVCTIVSTLCNVLVMACNRARWKPSVYEEGHVMIDIPNASLGLQEVFYAVKNVFEEVAEQNPDNVKLYW